MTSEKAHQILEKAGFDAVARDCLEKRKQLFDIALFVEKQGFGWLDKDTLNKDAKENRLMKFMISINRTGVMFTEQAHQILKNAGLDSESRKCLARNNQLLDIAKLVMRNREYLGSDKKTFIGLANKLAMENRINDLAVVIENSMWLTESDLTTMDKSLQSGLQEMKTIIEMLAEKSRGKRIKADLNNIVKGVYKEYISDISHIQWKKVRKKVLTKRWTGVTQGWQLRKIVRYVRRKRKLSAELKGKYIGNILSQCNYLLTHDQLGTMIKKFELTAKNIAELCEMGEIYRQEQNGTFLYAKSEMQFKQKWGCQVEYFSELFNRREITKTKRLLSDLVESALMEKGWQLDEIYMSILIRTVLQGSANINEKKTKG